MQNAEATRERILDAALAEFSAYGVAGARVDRIAKNAGCNKNLIYIYFENKETLFGTVLKKNLSKLYEDLPFTPEDLPEFAGRLFDFSLDRPDLYRLLAWSTLEREAPALEERAAARDAKIEKIRAAQEAGLVARTHSPSVLLTMIMGMATSWSGASPHGSPPSPDGGAGNVSADDIRNSVIRSVALITRPTTEAADKT
jgi:AcrR family transcriptional regulator